MIVAKEVNRLRALHVVNGEYFAGAERVQDLLALALPSFGVDIEFVTLKNGVFASKRDSRVAVYSACMNHRLDVGAMRKVRAIVEAGKFDYIHSHTPRAAVMSSLVSRSTGIPFIHHVHSPVNRDSERRLANKVNAVAENLAIRNAAALVCVSQSLFREYSLRYASLGGPRIFHIANGVRIDNQVSTARSGAGVMGMVALFRPRKGLEVALHAMHVLRERGLNFHFRAAGPFVDADYERHIKRMAIDLKLEDRITWVGFTDDVSKEMRALNFSVLPSLFGEGLPMVLLESMAVGTPVIAAAVEGIPEVVTHGVNGLLVRPGDVNELADAMATALQDDESARKMAAAARQTQRERYSDISMSSHLAQIYRSLREPKTD